jgi:hypothetical protein
VTVAGFEGGGEEFEEIDECAGVCEEGVIGKAALAGFVGLFAY